MNNDDALRFILLLARDAINMMREKQKASTAMRKKSVREATKFVGCDFNGFLEKYGYNIDINNTIKRGLYDRTWKNRSKEQF